jgi:hypothetical protein
MQSSRYPSPISISSMGSYLASCILCNANSTHIDLADLYHQQRQLTIHSAPPCTQFVDPMSSAASNESPHEAPLQLPPCHHNSLAPLALSPHTIQSTLQSQPDIDATLLWSIANGLLKTIADREATTAIATKRYEDWVHHLERRVLHYKESFNALPTGYTLNNGKIANFHILVGDGLYQEAKWIHLNNDGMVSGYHTSQGPNKQPHIIDLYTSPDFSINSPLGALPSWFCYMLMGPGGDFQILQQAVANMDDWGLTQETARYRKLNDDITALAIKIKQYQCDLDAAQAQLASCESHLMLACASKQVATLQNILRKVGTVRSGWKRGSRMPCGIHVHTAPLEEE